MRRLARLPSDLASHYDAVVVGSGYGGGVAAARLARAGKRVAVLERGREIATGDFPRKFSDLRNELQLSGRQLRLGSATGLYDVRLGQDMHVLVGCGLGGGSLINAGVALAQIGDGEIVGSLNENLVVAFRGAGDRHSPVCIRGLCAVENSAVVGKAAGRTCWGQPDL